MKLFYSLSYREKQHSEVINALYDVVQTLLANRQNLAAKLQGVLE